MVGILDMVKKAQFPVFRTRTIEIMNTGTTAVKHTITTLKLNNYTKFSAAVEQRSNTEIYQ
jgi:hypothetical protein